MCHVTSGSPQWLSGKEPTCRAGATGSIPGWETPWGWPATHSIVLARRIPGQRGELNIVHAVAESATAEQLSMHHACDG